MNTNEAKAWNLVDVGGVLARRPSRAGTAPRATILKALPRSGKRKRDHQKTRLSLEGEKTASEGARNVAFATTKQRMAMKGELNFVKSRFVDVTVELFRRPAINGR